MTNLVEIIAKSLVEQPDKVVVTKEEKGEDTLIVLQVASDDMGKVIGKQGRIAKAIRTVVKAAAKDESKVNVDIVSDEEVAQGLGIRHLEEAAEATVEAGEAGEKALEQ